MKSYLKLRTFSWVTIKPWLLLAVLLLCVFLSGTCLAEEKTYLVTESQLTTLEQNLTTLKTQNQTLQTQLQISQIQVQTLQKQSEILQTQSTQLQEQVVNLTQSLANAQELLNKYESNQQNKNYAIGLGVSNNSIALNADYKKVWLFVDTDTVAIGYKYKF